MNGDIFIDDEIELRDGTTTRDPKLDRLIEFALERHARAGRFRY